MPSNNDIVREYIQGDIRNGQIFDDRYVDKMETGIEASFHYSNYLEEHFGNEINNTKEELTQYTDNAKAAAIAHTNSEIAKTRSDLTAYTDAALEALDYNGASESGTATQFITQVTQADGLVSATKASIPTANGTTIGMVKQGGDVTISNGIITVNDDSHNHIISNVDGLQNALDSKATPANITSAIAALDYTSPATNGTALEFITTVNQADGVVSATKAAIPVASSDTLGLVKSGTDITVDSSGNVSVKNNSHTHTSANISDLNTTINTAITNAIGALDASDPAASGSATQFITSISQKDGVITAKKANITAAELGLSGAMKFLGISATAITDGATTNPIIIGSTSTTVTSGNVVLYGSKEFVWTGSAWEELGNEGSYKIQQSAVSSPSASGTETAFIDTISQNAQGVITATKKTVASATQSAAGLMSAADKTKLDGIAEGANNYTYTLPTASSSILGGVKIGTGIAISNGIISNSGVRSISTGTENGTISVNTNGTAENVAVKGLGSAAYKDALGTWEINITGSSGSCTGNAETATKLAIARTITLTGSVTGSGSFDGSGNLSIDTTTNHTHNYAGSSSAGGSAISAVKLDTATAGSIIQPVYFSEGKPVAIAHYLAANIGAYSGSLTSGGWAALNGRGDAPTITIGYNNNNASWNSSCYSASLVWGAEDTRGLLDCSPFGPIVTFGGGVYGNTTDDNPQWYMKLMGTSGQQYTFPTESKTLAANDGSNASGTWGINISGHAETATLLSLHNTMSSSSTRSTTASSWNGSLSGVTYMWGQSFKDTSIGSDLGDLILAIRPGVYTPNSTELCVAIDGDYYSMGQKVLHAGNYTDYAPSRSGSGASGTWPISITGNAASISSATPTLSTGVEANEITIKSNSNGSLANSTGSLIAIRSAMDFKWYYTHWQIGNIRSDNMDSAGFGFAYSSDDGNTFILKSYIDINGNYIGNAATATKATQDSNGNTITSTYATKSELNDVSTLVGNTAVNTQITNAVTTAINGLNIKNGSNQGIRQVTSTEEGTDYSLGRGATALGISTKATNQGCFASGLRTTACGNYSHAEGSGGLPRISISGQGTSYTINIGFAKKGNIIVYNNIYVKIIEVDGNVITVDPELSSTQIINQQVILLKGVAYGDCSHIEGIDTTASGDASHTEGRETIASGPHSHAEGYHTIASSQYQHVQGYFNIEDGSDKYAHIVGNGSSAVSSNAHTLDWSGNAWFQGSVYVGGKGQTDTAAIKILPAKLVSTETTPTTNDTIYWLYE